jgi:hypothetical protein
VTIIDVSHIRSTRDVQSLLRIVEPEMRHFVLIALGYRPVGSVWLPADVARVWS